MDAQAPSRSVGHCYCNAMIVALMTLFSYPLNAAAESVLSDRQLLQQTNFSDTWRIFPFEGDRMTGVKNPCWSRRSEVYEESSNKERASVGVADSWEGGGGSEQEEEIICLVSRFNSSNCLFL